jgi:hypothetical protein
VVIHRLPGPETLGQVAPRRAAAKHPEHGVQKLAWIGQGSATRCLRQQRLDHHPLFIRELVTAHPLCPPILAVRGESGAAYDLQPFSDRT